MSVLEARGNSKKIGCLETRRETRASTCEGVNLDAAWVQCVSKISTLSVHTREKLMRSSPIATVKHFLASTAIDRRGEECLRYYCLLRCRSGRCRAMNTVVGSRHIVDMIDHLVCTTTPATARPRGENENLVCWRAGIAPWHNRVFYSLFTPLGVGALSTPSPRKSDLIVMTLSKRTGLVFLITRSPFLGDATTE